MTTAPSPAQLAAAFADIATRTGWALGPIVINEGQIHAEVTDPAAQHALVAAYGLTRDATLTGTYAGLVHGVRVTVALSIPRGVIPARGAA